MESDYEKVRRERIQANNARLAQLGLGDLARDIASHAVDRSPPQRDKAKASATPVRRSSRLRALKSKNEEIDESDEEEEMIVSREIRDDEEEEYIPLADEEVSDDDLKDEELVNAIDEDDGADLQEAIALSMGDSSLKHVKPSGKQDSKRKRKPGGGTSFRLSAREIDALYQSLAGGRKGFSLHELQQAAAAHNFTWTRQELQDMISMFDTNQDGMLSHAEFLNMSARCLILED